MNRPGIVMTYELAMAAAWDEGNRSMRKAGRKKWNRDDQHAAFEAMERFYPTAQRHMCIPASEGGPR